MQSTIKRKTILRTNAIKLWDALTNPEKTKLYMFNCEVSSSWALNMPITWQGNFEGYESGERGTILAFEIGKKLKYTSFDPNFGLKDEEKNYLHITYIITHQDPKHIVLETIIENFNGDANRLKHIAAGWDNYVLPGIAKLFNN